MATSKAQQTPQDAIAMLTADHQKVRALFEEFSDTKDDADEDEKAALVAKICNELTLHAQLEEEIFYPAVRKAIEDSDLMDEALVEHACAKELIAQLESMDPKDKLYDAKVTVLGEQIDHHAKEEEDNMFAQAKKAKVDAASLGSKMLKRKTALMAELGIEHEESEEEDSPAAKKTGSKRG
ncbi:MAG: hemerythrin domain-containing protein [Pseudomonadota bacterium]|nr:hemerythrin domain-containing protein [Pseudomonadota bacterium]